MIHLSGPHTPDEKGYCNGCDIQHEPWMDNWVYELRVGGITIRLCAGCMGSIERMFKGRRMTIKKLRADTVSVAAAPKEQP